MSEDEYAELCAAVEALELARQADPAAWRAWRDRLTAPQVQALDRLLSMLAFVA